MQVNNITFILKSFLLDLGVYLYWARGLMIASVVLLAEISDICGHAILLGFVWWIAILSGCWLILVTWSLIWVSVISCIASWPVISRSRTIYWAQQLFFLSSCLVIEKISSVPNGRLIGRGFMWRWLVLRRRPWANLVQTNEFVEFWRCVVKDLNVEIH